MSDERYADAIGEVTLTGPIVRIDLVSFSATEKDEKNQPKLVFRERILMPVDGFVRSFALMAQAIQQLEKQGVIRRQPGDAPGASPFTPSNSAPSSSNFK